MNHAARQIIIGMAVALAVGVVLARIMPGSPSSPASAGIRADGQNAATPVPAETALARVVRTETGAKRWLVVLAQAEKAEAAKIPSLIRSVGSDGAMIRMLAARWAELDPAHMFASLYADYLLPDGAPGTLPGRAVLTDVLIEEWAKKDVDAVIKALTDVPSFSQRDSLRMSVVNRALKADVEKGLLAMKEWNIRHYVPDMKSVADWAARDPQHAAEVVAGMGAEYAAREAMKYVGKAWAQKDPEGGLRYAITLEGGSRASLASEIMGAWALRDLDAAVKFVTAQDEPEVRNAVAQGLVKTWAKTDAAAALGWSQENLRGFARNEAIGDLIKTASEKSIEDAGTLVAGMEPSAAQNRACVSIFETWFNKGKDQREAALSWLAELPDPKAREAALQQVQWNWAWNDPNGVRDFVSGPHGGIASASLIHQVARNQTAKNPEGAMEWAGSLPSDRATIARQAVLDNWLQVRPDGATEYVLKMAAGKERSAAVGSIAQSLAFNPASREAAMEWFRKLPTADHAAVRGALDGMQVSPFEKKRIEEALSGK